MVDELKKEIDKMAEEYYKKQAEENQTNTADLEVKEGV